jgi:hypothetical protein
MMLLQTVLNTAIEEAETETEAEARAATEVDS